MTTAAEAEKLVMIFAPLPDETTWRWLRCLHESSHLVVGLIFCLPKERGLNRGFVFDGTGGGLACMPSLHGVDHAVATAAGKAGEGLAATVKPPLRRAPRARVLENMIGPIIATAWAKCDREDLDEVQVAKYCVAGVEADPQRWLERHARVTLYARQAVAQHAIRIIRLADVLFRRGIALSGDVKRSLRRQRPLPASRFIPQPPPADAGALTTPDTGKEN